MNKIYKGFVTLPRDVQLLPLWDNPHDTVLWLYCLLHASHQSYKELQPGQFYASQKKIAEELKWSRKTVGVCLRRLEQKEMLRADTSDLGTVITVMHWDEISSGRGLCGGPAGLRDAPCASPDSQSDGPHGAHGPKVCRLLKNPLRKPHSDCRIPA